MKNTLDKHGFFILTTMAILCIGTICIIDSVSKAVVEHESRMCSFEVGGSYKLYGDLDFKGLLDFTSLRNETNNITVRINEIGLGAGEASTGGKIKVTVPCNDLYRWGRLLTKEMGNKS